MIFKWALPQFSYLLHSSLYFNSNLKAKIIKSVLKINLDIMRESQLS